MVSLLSILNFVFIFQCASCLGNDSFPVVNITNGPIMGSKFTSLWTNKTIYAFQGIPYAAPPIGDLRFKDPQPANNWTEVLDCTRNDTAWCMQEPMWGTTPPSVSEDCLLLNVYSPEINVSSEALWPVMVWVPGGGWIAGSGAQELYGPDMLLAEGIVFVSLNYRLGAFGFLSLGSSDAPGNVGLKDQVLALKWVQREISKFGGDPNRVTLSGESAASFSVHLHYLSPLSKGLFHRVIGESGAAIRYVAIENGTSFALSLAEIINCSTADTSSALQCLLNTSADDILTNQNLVVRGYEENFRGDGLVWRAVVDKNSSTEPFLPEMPMELYRQGQGSYVPFIMGTNKDEGLIHLGSDAQVKNITDLENLKLLIPEEVQKLSTEEQILAKAQSINAFYFNGTTPSLETNYTSYVNLYTDVCMAYPTAQSARLFSTRGDVYLYHFVFYGSFKKGYTGESDSFKFVSHAEEMNYLFVVANVTQNITEDSDERRTWRSMVRMWTNFVKYGTPTTFIKDEVVQYKSWDPIDNTTLKYFVIDTDLTMMSDSNYMGPNLALWDNIYSYDVTSGVDSLLTSSFIISAFTFLTSIHLLI